MNYDNMRKLDTDEKHIFDIKQARHLLEHDGLLDIRQKKKIDDEEKKVEKIKAEKKKKKIKHKKHVDKNKQ